MALRRLAAASPSSVLSRQTSLASGITIQRRGFAVVNLSDESAVEKFRQVNSKSVLYFTATWCPPCKTIAPVYEEMSDKYPKVAFGKVDVDDNSDAAIEFEISAVPTFVLFDGDTAVEKFSGADSAKLEKHVVDLEGR